MRIEPEKGLNESGIRERFFTSCDAAAAISERTALVDSLVRARWAPMPEEAALAAVGGYGRSELFPCSDVDLLILIPDEAGAESIKAPLSTMLRDLWDQQLRISQSVHTPAECNQIDAANAELAVSLLDRRWLAGNEDLFRQIRQPRPELGRHIAELTRQRYEQYQNTIYHLEPDVKDAPGGLRDLQVLRWLSKLGAGDEEAVSGSGVALLFQLRCFLHFIAGRDENRFTFERQDEIARLLGSESPEALMRSYYRAVRDISRVATRRLERFEARRSSLFAQFRDRAARLSNAEFTVLHGHVLLRSPHAIESDAGMVLRLFQFVGRHGLPLAADTAERLERLAHFEAPEPVWPAFREILNHPHAATAIRAMHETRILEAIFPELGAIEALVIRDFYHRYTVDEHSLVAIEGVTGLRGRREDPFGELAQETDDFDLLLAALLFHDVGKGAPGESHVQASGRIAEGALRRAGISERALSLVTFLIGAHLEMSAAMNGRDISDPVTGRDMAARTGTVERLKLLTLLTYADISAVNPAAMTPWRRQLLWNLYTASYAELTRELTDRASAPQTDMPEQTRRLLEGLPPRYLRTHSSDEIAEHARLMEKALEKRISVSLAKGAGAWILTVVALDRPFLFASVAAAISSFGFNILKAEAFSNARGMVIDSFTFADAARSLELNPDETRQVTRTVVKAVEGEIAVAELLARRPKVKPDAYALAAARATFDNSASPSATLLHLVTQDRPGLLYDVASLISRRGGNIEVVLVDTEAKKAIDVFYVTRDGAKLSDEAARELAEAVAEITRRTETASSAN